MKQIVSSLCVSLSLHSPPSLLSFFLLFYLIVQSPYLIYMDITNNASTSSTWDLDMGNNILLDQTPYELFHPLEPFQPHVTPPSFPTAQAGDLEEEEECLGAMKEMMYKIAAMQPVDIDPATIKKPKRRNVRISDDPQSVAARHRRERISERIRILQRLVPGGTKMDTASMLDEAIRYVKFLKRQVQELQEGGPQPPRVVGGHLVAPGMEWTGARPTDGHASSSSSSAGLGPHPGLGFGFSSDASCSHMP